jgi:hypothetical protein
MMRRLQSFARGGTAAGAQLSAGPTLIPGPLTEALAALGYVGSRATRTPATSEPLPDAKDCIGRHLAMSAFQPR